MLSRRRRCVVVSEKKEEGRRKEGGEKILSSQRVKEPEAEVGGEVEARLSQPFTG